MMTMNDTLSSPPANDLAPLDLIGKALDLIGDANAVSGRVKELQTAMARNSAIWNRAVTNPRHSMKN